MKTTNILFHSLIAANSLCQLQTTAGDDPVNDKEKSMTFNIPEK